MGYIGPALGIPCVRRRSPARGSLGVCATRISRGAPSQGTHFFQNLTSFGTGYFTVDPASGTGFVDTAYLDLHAGRNGDRTRAVVRFDSPLMIAINGRKVEGYSDEAGNRSRTVTSGL